MLKEACGKHLQERKYGISAHPKVLAQLGQFLQKLEASRPTQPASKIRELQSLQIEV